MRIDQQLIEFTLVPYGFFNICYKDSTEHRKTNKDHIWLNIIYNIEIFIVDLNLFLFPPLFVCLFFCVSFDRFHVSIGEFVCELIQNDDWNIDTIFPLNNDFLNEFNDLADINMDANWADAYDYMSSPTTSTGTESENDHDMLGMKPVANQMLSPPQNLISSSSSDSGLSSDHVDL